MRRMSRVGQSWMGWCGSGVLTQRSAYVPALVVGVTAALGAATGLAQNCPPVTQTERVSVATDGTQSNDRSLLPAINQDGCVVAFKSYASNLVANDTNEKVDVFVRDRGAAELRSIGPVFAREGEAAFSVELPWQSHGVGTVLLERTLLSARNRGIKLLRMHCLADNRRMQQLASKFEADLKFDFGSVVGEVDPPRFTLLSLTREMVNDAHSVATAVLDVQSRLLKPA